MLGAEPRDCVLPPMTAYGLAAPAGASEMGVPETVIRPPGVSVWPATTNRKAELAVYVEPPKVSTAGAEAGAGVMRAWVLPSTTAALAPDGRDIAVPATLIEPPCVNVCPAVTNSEDQLRSRIGRVC